MTLQRVCGASSSQELFTRDQTSARLAPGSLTVWSRMLRLSFRLRRLAQGTAVARLPSGGASRAYRSTSIVRGPEEDMAEKLTTELDAAVVTMDDVSARPRRTR